MIEIIILNCKMTDGMCVCVSKLIHKFFPFIKFCVCFVTALLMHCLLLIVIIVLLLQN